MSACPAMKSDMEILMPKKYSARQKTRKLGRYDQLRKAGKTAQQAAKAVGVGYPTLLKWEKEGERPGKRAGEIDIDRALAQAFAAAKNGPKMTTAAPSVPSEGMVLVTPSGYRLQGLSSKDLYMLLDALE